MDYVITQMPNVPEISDTNQPKTTVQPIETLLKQSFETDETVLSFPASYPKVAEVLNTKGLKCNANTLRGRWKDKYILPVINGVDMPDVVTDNGITEFGFNIIAEIISRCIQGEKGMKIAPETLREEMIERYGLIPVKDSLKDSQDLLQRSEALKSNADEKRESVALAKVEAVSELETLKSALQNLNASQDTDDEPYELTEQEKAQLLKRHLRKQIAEQEFLQKVARGEI